MTDLSQNIINLESKVIDLETDNLKLRESIAAQASTIARQERDLKRVSDDRDFRLEQNSEFKTLLNSTARLILDGIENIKKTEASLKAVNAAATAATNGGSTTER